MGTHDAEHIKNYMMPSSLSLLFLQLEFYRLNFKYNYIVEIALGF